MVAYFGRRGSHPPYDRRPKLPMISGGLVNESRVCPCGMKDDVTQGLWAGVLSSLGVDGAWMTRMLNESAFGMLD